MKRKKGMQGKGNMFDKFRVGREWEKGNHELVIVKIGHRKK